MKDKLGKFTLMITTLVLFLVLTVGYMTPEMANRAVVPKSGTVVAWDGMHGLLAPVVGGGSSAG